MSTKGKTVFDEYGAKLKEALKAGKAGAFRFTTWKDGGMIATLDKGDFAKAAGRLNKYKHIPAKKGKFVFANVANYLLTDEEGPVQTYFKTQSGPDGAWEPLSENTLRLPERKGGREGNPMLMVTEHLYKAVSNPQEMVDIMITGKYARMVIQPTSKGNNLQVKYAAHMTGAEIYNGWGKNIRISIPPRPFMPTTPKDLTNRQKKDVRDRIEEGLLDAAMS